MSLDHGWLYLDSADIMVIADGKVARDVVGLDPASASLVVELTAESQEQPQ